VSKKLLIIIILFIVVFGGSQTFFVVDQTQQTLVLQLGKPLKALKEPGLYMKVPFLQQVIVFEKRILEYDAAPAEILSSDKKNLVVDNYSKWRIIDPLKFFQTVRDITGAQSRLDDIIYAQLRVILGKNTLIDVVSEKRDAIMRLITSRADKIANSYGIQVVDVRIKRADLPPQNEKHVYERMRAERQREAKRYRSEGKEVELRIRAEAEKERTIILAEAYKKSQTIRGEADAKSLKIYAQAYEKDPGFYAFVRSLEAYEKAFTDNQNTTLVLVPDNWFLQYFSKAPKDIE
jgi:membrane protease subunit HflC